MFVQVLLLLTLQGVCSFDFQIEPRKLTLRPGQRATILCRANVALTKCRFLLPGDVVADLSRGAATPATSEYRYYGTGLENGQCGITLLSPESGFEAVACQGRTEREGWKRDAMFLRVTNMPTLPWDVDRHHIVVLPGTNVNFLCRSQYALSDCRIGFVNEDRWISFSQGASSPATSEYRYFGTGLESGQCGITMLNARDELSGEVRCVGIAGTRWAGAFTTLVVAKTPDQPDLQITNVNEGDTFVATCTVTNGRPAATINWYIDGKLVTDGITDNSPNNAWFDYQIQTKVEKLAKRVTWRDHGKDIKCVANHPALFDYLNQDTKYIDVKFKPQSIQQAIKISGLVVGQPGVIRFEILANPKPLLTWSFSDLIVEDDDTSATGRYKALPAEAKGHGKWEAKLQISDVTENDFGIMFSAKAKNQVGSSTYRISLEGDSQYTPPPAVKPVEIRPTPSSQQVTSDCGRPLISVQLVIRGNQTQEGNWPWIAAMFIRRPRKAGLEFQCGGTLINKNHVVTAAHCVKAEGKTLSPADIFIYLGKHNLNDWVAPNAQTKQVAGIHIHPDYLGTHTGDDLAVLVFTSPAKFTSYVRPICLWNRDTVLSSVVGQFGFLAGWGRVNPDEDGVSEVPRMSKSAIVSHEDCIRSNTDFAHFTTEKTFCAGLRDGSGPCNGDSGSGFFIPYKVNGQNRWFLRGLVSSALADSSTGSCDLKNYIVYTDVAKFGTWIMQFEK